MFVPFIKFIPTSQLDFVASIQACHIVIFAFNKYPLRPGIALCHSVYRGWVCQGNGVVRVWACCKPSGCCQGECVFERDGLES